jgi:RNA polymerase sigma-70 factor (ECF subfamily)
MEQRDALAERFELERAHLRAVGYRLLGSWSEAEDAVQDAWLRLERTRADEIVDLRGWLTAVVGRICLDRLRARKVRNEEYAGTWLPEPVVSAQSGDPAHEALQADAVGIALLVVLETLTPAERLAFVLHDVFAMSYDEIGTIVDKSAVAVRQLASRARRRVQTSAPDPDADLRVQRRVVDAFLAAARAGDFEALLGMLDPDAVLRTDGGGIGPLARPPIVGAEAVAHQFQRSGPRFAGYARPAIVNGAAGAIVETPGFPTVVVGFTVVSGRVAAVDLIGDPAKLRGLITGGETAE